MHRSGAGIQLRRSRFIRYSATPTIQQLRQWAAMRMPGRVCCETEEEVIRLSKAITEYPQPPEDQAPKRLPWQYSWQEWCTKKEIRDRIPDYYSLDFISMIRSTKFRDMPETVPVLNLFEADSLKMQGLPSGRRQRYAGCNTGSVAEVLCAWMQK